MILNPRFGRRRGSPLWRFLLAAEQPTVSQQPVGNGWSHVVATRRNTIRHEITRHGHTTGPATLSNLRRGVNHGKSVSIADHQAAESISIFSRWMRSNIKINAIKVTPTPASASSFRARVRNTVPTIPTT